MRLFGTDGIRGKANVHPITPQMAIKIGQAIGIHFKKKYPHPNILIGKDTRRSGYMLEQALGSGINSVGVDVGQIGPLPTPGIAYLTRGLRACAGIVISASHNPFYDNGIKIFNHEGRKLDSEIQDQIENLIIHNDLDSQVTFDGEIGRSRRIDDAIGQYAVFLKEQFPKDLTLEGKRIVLDCANGASYKVAPKVFEELGAKMFYLGVEPNGVNINDGCGALYPQILQEKVRLYKADIGIALDGDADRLIVVDDKGKIFDGDDYLAAVAPFMAKQGTLAKNSVVTTVMSNLGLKLYLEKQGVDVHSSKVGDRYVMEEMQNKKINLGAEPSGHIILSDVSTTGDGILAALQLLQVMIRSGEPLSKISKDFIKIPQITKSFVVKEKVPLDQMADVKNSIQKAQTKLGNEGRVLFRYSGTEPKARIMVEGYNEKEIEGTADELVQLTLKSIDTISGVS